MIYNLIISSTGELVSDSREPITSIPEGMEVVETPDRNGVWNPLTRIYDAYPKQTKYKKADFFKKVGLTQFLKVSVASESDAEVKALLNYINGLDNLDLADSEMIVGLDMLVTKGIWTQEEVDALNE